MVTGTVPARVTHTDTDKTSIGTTKHKKEKKNKLKDLMVPGRQADVFGHHGRSEGFAGVLPASPLFSMHIGLVSNEDEVEEGE